MYSMIALWEVEDGPNKYLFRNNTSVWQDHSSVQRSEAWQMDTDNIHIRSNVSSISAYLLRVPFYTSDIVYEDNCKKQWEHSDHHGYDPQAGRSLVN